MRVYLRCFRCRKLISLLLIFILVAISVRMGHYLKYKTAMPFSFIGHKKSFYFNPKSTNFTVGAFLKGRPLGNVSYCIFRYGDAENFTFTDEELSLAPELGEKGPYRVLYGAVEGVTYNATDPVTVTYVTHVTLEYVLHIAEVVTRWDGLLSVACFLPGSDVMTALKLLRRLCACVKEMENVNVHFVFPATHLPNASSHVADATPTSTNESTSLPVTDTCYFPVSQLAPTYRTKYGLVYPVNVARNVARLGCKSEYILVSDVELLPSEHLVPEFLTMVKRLKDRSKTMGDHYFTKKRHVFVVPVFEVSEDEADIPRTKPQLLDLYAKERAVYFHRHVCLHCQRFPGLQRWLQRKVNPRTKQTAIQPLLVVRREFPYHRWEPVYIGTNQEPFYSEVLTWEGQQDKMTQMHEMCLLDYRFVILNGAFLVHMPGMKRRQDKVTVNSILSKEQNRRILNRTSPNLETLFTKRLTSGADGRTKHIRRNEYLYQLITHDVVSKYKKNPKCRIH